MESGGFGILNFVYTCDSLEGYPAVDAGASVAALTAVFHEEDADRLVSGAMSVSFSPPHLSMNCVDYSGEHGVLSVGGSIIETERVFSW